jgi:AcrR family transcriptional regulator
MCTVSTSGGGYHHGDLRAALLDAATSLVEAEGELSLRAVARQAGVSANAPYRHYPDKDALLAAVATRGFQDLRVLLVEADSAAAAGDEFVALAQAYVRFALAHPGRFRLMFGHPCSRSHPETLAAAAEATAVLQVRVAASVPAERREAYLVGGWSLVHGLASLVLDGKLTPDGPVDDLVRTVVGTTFTPA